MLADFLCYTGSWAISESNVISKAGGPQFIECQGYWNGRGGRAVGLFAKGIIMELQIKSD